MEGLLSQHKSQFIEAVVEAPFGPGPVKLLTSAQSHNGFQPIRKSSRSIAVDSTTEYLASSLNDLHQFASQKELCVTKKVDDERRSHLQGKKVLFVCCGHAGLDSKKFAFELAKEDGVRSFLVEDGRNALAVSLERCKIIEQFIRVDMTPRVSLLQDVVDALERVSVQVGKFDAVCTLWDDAVCLCARIAEHFGLPGSSVKSVDIAHDKHLTREAMKSAGLPTPANYLIKSEKDLAAAADVVGAPSILKPMYGASSLGVVKIDDVEHLKGAYQHVLEMLEHFYEAGELMGLTFNESELGPSFQESSLGWLVMEEFLDGDEVDVDLVLKDGKIIYQCVVDDWPQIQPWFVEMGNTCPSGLPTSSQQELVNMAFQSTTAAMGFSDGVFHCELKNTSKGPRLIEVNPRMGGGPVWSMHKLAFGLDMVEETLYSALRVPGVPNVPKSPRSFVACSEKFFQESMIIPKEFARVVVVMRLFPNVVEATPLVQPGEKIVGIKDGFPTRTARFIACGDSSADVKFYTQKLLDMCDIPQVVKAQRFRA